MVEVCIKKNVPENCSTCLYGPNAVGWDGKPIRRLGCAHADRQKDWMHYALIKSGCPSFWLDQNRFQR